MNSGIYLLRNTVNGKIYVGKSLNLRKRISQYRCVNEDTEARPIVNAIRKYGWGKFEVEILEIVDDDSILERESFWIKAYNSTDKSKGYNILEFHTDWTGRRHSDESKQKMRKNHPNFSKENHPRWGTKHSEESKKKMSEKKKNTFISDRNPFWNKKHTEETKKIISEKNKERDFSYRKKKVNQMEASTSKVIKTWDSAQEASLSLCGKKTNYISLVCRGKLKTAFGFKWEYSVSIPEDKG
jgi:group I intron endonuclease